MSFYNVTFSCIFTYTLIKSIMKTKEQLQNRLIELKLKSKYNRSEVMKNSHRMSRRYGGFNGDYLGECIDNENERVALVAEEIECIEYKLKHYNYLLSHQNTSEVTQEAYNSTKTLGYMGATCNE